MSCRVVRRYIDPYVDGEVDPTTRIEFDRHIAECASCQQEASFVRAVKARVREGVGATRAPVALRDRIGAALDGVDRDAARGPWVRVLPVRKRYAIPIAAAAAALMVMTYTLAPDSGRGEVRASAMPILEDVVRVHAADLPADVKGAQPQQVTTYFRNKLRFPVRPAKFERRDAQLVGARLSNVRGRRAAALYYNVGGHRLTVVVFEHPDRLEQGAQRTRLMGRDLLYRQVNGYVVPMRAQDGLTYAFTGDLDRRSILRLAATARVSY